MHHYEQMGFDFDFEEIAPAITHVKYEWTDEDVEKLREGILMDALRSLRDGRQSKESRQETIEWIMSDDIAPFSFVICCQSQGLMPERVRDGVNAILQKERVQIH